MTQNCIRDFVSKKFEIVLTDSRKIIPGALFVALTGDKFDGHDFIDEVISKGAKGILFKKGNTKAIEAKKKYPNVYFYDSDNVIESYRAVANAWRSQFRIPVIVVAGSVGKTTTKEMLAAMLSGKFKSILKTTASQNGEIGIPMTLLEMRPHHDIAVIEVGIDSIGTMQRHLDLVRPTHGLLTAIGPEHLERLKDIQTVAKEEGIVMDWLATNQSKLAIRVCDPWIAPYALKFPTKLGSSSSTKMVANILTYGMKNHIQVESTHPLMLGEVIGTNLNVLHKDKTMVFHLPLPGAHNAINLLGTLSIGVLVGMNEEQMKEGLLTFVPTSGRTEIKILQDGARGPKGLKVICDYYNANPSSMAAALELLAKEKNSTNTLPRNRIAILGDMLELGNEEEKYHRNLSEFIQKFSISKVFLYGPRMKWLANELSSRGFGYAKHFENYVDLTEDLRKDLNSADLVLLKGSRGMKMEEVFKNLI